VLSFYSKFTNLVKTDMSLINGENRVHSDLARQIYIEKFRQMILPNARTFVNVVQHLRDFELFEMNKRDLGRQLEDRILVAEVILYETKNQPGTWRLANPLEVSQFVVWRRYPKGARLTSTSHSKNSGTKTTGFTVDVSFHAFTHNYSLFTLLFNPLLFSE
jgi:hypothetical protein